jgi:hypothetical protein
MAAAAAVAAAETRNGCPKGWIDSSHSSSSSQRMTASRTTNHQQHCGAVQQRTWTADALNLDSTKFVCCQDAICFQRRYTDAVCC